MLTVIVDAAHWAAARHDEAYRPAALDELGYVPCRDADEADHGLHPLRLLLRIDPERLGSPVDTERGHILGPIDRTAIVEVVPLRPRTPDGHTLHGVLTRLHLGERTDPEVARRLDAAFAREIGVVRGWVRAELRGFPGAETEELVQDVLAAGWARLPDYVPNARFRAYLKAIALHKCSNARRKLRDALTEDGALDAESQLPDALARLEGEERDALLEQASRAVLDPLEQELVQLRYVCDYPLEDIAARLASRGGDVPRDANAVRVALQRIRRRLKAEITRRLSPPEPPSRARR